MNFKLIEREKFTVTGKTTTIRCKDSHIMIPEFWEECKKDGTIEALHRLSEGNIIMGVGEVPDNDDCFKYMIGAEMKQVKKSSMESMTIPKSTWAVFEPVISEPQNVIPIWNYIFNDFFPNGKYKFAHTPDLEVNKKIDEDRYTCEIWVPVIEKQGNEYNNFPAKISDWNPKQAQLRTLISKPDRFDDAMQLCLDLHSVLHCSEVSSMSFPSYLDRIWNGMTANAFITMPTSKDVTIAWNIWHITRIEDITTNILIADSEQVLNNDWLGKLNVSVTDTGNAMNDDEILSLSHSLNMDALKNYRNAVGTKTRAVIKNLNPNDMKRKVNPESIERIKNEGGVTDHSESIWLLDFWGRKDIAGIILMPITRHQIIHLSDSMKIKNKILKLQ